jgi:hypothetical protein
MSIGMQESTSIPATKPLTQHLLYNIQLVNVTVAGKERLAIT